MKSPVPADSGGGVGPHQAGDCGGPAHTGVYTGGRTGHLGRVWASNVQWSVAEATLEITGHGH